MKNWESECAAEVPGKLLVHSPNLARLKFSVKVVRHRVRLWKAVEKLVPGEDAKFSEIGSPFGGAFGSAQFVDESVYVLLADALAVSFRAAVGIDVVPPGAAFVMAKSFANQFAHGAALFLGDGLGTLQHVGRKGHGKSSSIPHAHISYSRILPCLT
jgi:hypothetical protein